MAPIALRLRLLLCCAFSAASVVGLTDCTGTMLPKTGVSVAPAVDPYRKIAIVGDSISAGFQNGALLDTQQQHGWAALFAQQAGASLTLPLVAAPGVPAVYELVQASLPPVLGVASGTSTGRENPSVQATDFAVPGYNLSNLLIAHPLTTPPVDDGELLTNLVLGYPAGETRTQLDQAVALQPSTIFLWIGSVDALPALGDGDPSSMTSVSDFTTEYGQVLTALKAATNANLIAANVPDVTRIPYMTGVSLALDIVEQQTGLTPAVVEPMLQIYPGDLLNQAGLGMLQAAITQIENHQTPTPIAANGVLTAAEVLQVQTTIIAYNQSIAQQVVAAGGVLVDMHALVDAWATTGVTLDNYHASALYLGGLFSLDGIHPSNTGYALMANQFIASANAALGTSVPMVDASTVAASDPLFGPNRPSSDLPYLKRRLGPSVARNADALVLGLRSKR